MKIPIYEKDYLIQELPQFTLDLIHKSGLPWLNSLPFCTGYGAHPANRIWLKMDNDKIYDAVFYRLIRLFPFNVIEVVGFPNCTERDIIVLSKKHNAHIILVNRLENAIKSDEEWHANQYNVFHHSYVTIVALPATKEEYLTQLGKNKRKQLPQWCRRMYRYFDDDLDIRFDKKADIRLEDIIQLEHLNKERRGNKGKGVDSDAAIQERQTRIFPLAQAYGMLMTIRHKGEIIGGNLNYIHGNKAYMLITGHNAALEELRIGNVAIWKTMEYLIDNGINECNFLWGRKFYKTQFLGIEYPWSVHILSPYRTLAAIWKYKLSFHAFYSRVMGFLKGRIGFYSNIKMPHL